jgi:Transmembrane family 220, helix
VSRTIAIFALLYFYVMSRKIVSLVLALLFALFAGFQYNDPDPWLWIGIYGYVAVTGFLAAAGKYWLLAITLGLGAYLAGLVYLAPSVYQWLAHHRDVSLLYGMAPDRPYIEQSREWGGLLIAWLAMLYFYRGAKLNP